jgi:chromosome segregation ATPase
MSPQASEQAGALTQRALGQYGLTQAVISFDKMSAGRNEPERPTTQIDSLRLEVKRCEELLQERDATIEAQCFHIGALYCNVSRLTNEKEKATETVASLQNQLKDLQEQDWQTHSGVRKKRKFNH